ncbi:hypothetical protein LJR090_004247 [Bosea sp. LjRoot90]|uniref:hypothetical protein n=1 Tax=Bosea sp. LjRoot90 TaxID=3342342 RepID=UPI003ECD548A
MMATGETQAMDHVISELLHRYVRLDRKEIELREAHITEADVKRWAGSYPGSLEAMFDAIAEDLARRFNSGEIEFWQGDFIANTLFTRMLDYAPDGIPFCTLVWEVYEAFDAGEYSRTPNDDPIRTYTVPRIAGIVGDLDAKTRKSS